jgi:hypothetical protein
MNKMLPKVHPLEYRFTDKEITAWGGLRLVEEMLRKIGFREALNQSQLPVGGSNAAKDVRDLMESFLVTIWTGGNRFSHTASVRFDPVISKMFDWKSVPSVATFTRFFNRFTQPKIDTSFGNLGRWFWSQMQPGTRTLDFDSTVITRYGGQEGAQKGYNPQNRGKGSHHPLMAFVADLRMVLHGWMRPGNTNDASNAQNFVREALDLLGPEQKVGLIRADSGFCTGALLGLFEEKKLSYIVSARLLSTVRRQLCGLKDWVDVGRGIAVSEMKYQAQGWHCSRRLVAVRHTIGLKSSGRFLLDVPGYMYSIYVTNLELAPAEVWRLYHGRADSENRIKELGEDFGMRGFASENFWATEAAFRSVLLAYNLFALFRQAVLGGLGQQTLSTLRFKCIAIGAALGTEGRRRVIRLSLPDKNRKWIQGLFSIIGQLTAPWKLKQLQV